MGKSSIEWTDETWNPTRGCDKVSPGCKHCYAETFAERWRGVKGHPYEQGFDLRLVREKLYEPMRWKKPRRVFVNSMSDLFHEDVPDEFIASVFSVMAACPQHTFQVLTKRAERLPEWFAWRGKRTVPTPVPTWPPSNVWLGVSVEDQERADERIPHLLRTPAAVRFLSCEPLLGPLDLRGVSTGGDDWLLPTCCRYDKGKREDGSDACNGPGCMGTRIDWCIVGGESGAGARPMRLEWARSIVEQCRAASVPVFVKQLGASPASSPTATLNGQPFANIRLKSRKGGDPSEWPADLRVREWPKK